MVHTMIFMGHVLIVMMAVDGKESMVNEMNEIIQNQDSGLSKFEYTVIMSSLIVAVICMSIVYIIGCKSVLYLTVVGITSIVMNIFYWVNINSERFE